MYFEKHHDLKHIFVVKIEWCYKLFWKTSFFQVFIEFSLCGDWLCWVSLKRNLLEVDWKRELAVGVVGQVHRGVHAQQVRVARQVNGFGLRSKKISIFTALMKVYIELNTISSRIEGFLKEFSYSYIILIWFFQ